MGKKHRNRKMKRFERGNQIGHVLLLEVTGIAPGGWGVAQDGKVRYFVWGGLPGDRVEARVESLERGRIQTRVKRLLKGQIPRIDSRCQHFSVCGGCLWQDLAYEDQVVLKKAIVEFCLNEVGLHDLVVEEILGTQQEFFYRNRMDFSFGWHPPNRLGLGLFVSPKKVNTCSTKNKGRIPPVFDLENCWLQSERSNRTISVVRSALKGYRVEAYNPETRSGVLRSLVILEGKRSGELLVNLKVSSIRNLPIEKVVKALKETVEGVKGVVISVNREKSKNAISKSQEVFLERGWILERISGMDLEISPDSFFQVNTCQAELLYDLVVQLANPESDERVLDLYCGSGTLSLRLAQKASLVMGVEVIPNAIESAKRNALRNGITNCQFFCGDVLQILPGIFSKSEMFDLVTVNPPRAGIYRAVIKMICQLCPRQIIYISCNPETLARDLVSFRAGGYLVDKVQPLDFFPQTPHCEIVVNMFWNAN